jgi:hypothetical protein
MACLWYGLHNEDDYELIRFITLMIFLVSFLDLRQRDIFLWPSYWDVLDQDQDINRIRMLLLFLRI